MKTTGAALRYVNNVPSIVFLVNATLTVISTSCVHDGLNASVSLDTNCWQTGRIVLVNLIILLVFIDIFSGIACSSLFFSFLR